MDLYQSLPVWAAVPLSMVHCCALSLLPDLLRAQLTRLKPPLRGHLEKLLGIFSNQDFNLRRMLQRALVLGTQQALSTYRQSKEISGSEENDLAGIENRLKEYADILARGEDVATLDQFIGNRDLTAVLLDTKLENTAPLRSQYAKQFILAFQRSGLVVPNNFGKFLTEGQLPVGSGVGTWFDHVNTTLSALLRQSGEMSEVHALVLQLESMVGRLLPPAESRAVQQIRLAQEHFLKPVRPKHLVGRDIYLRALDLHLEKKTRACLVAGPAGYGKTALLDAWLQSLLKRGIPVARHFFSFRHSTERTAAYCWDSLLRQLSYDLHISLSDMRYPGLPDEQALRQFLTHGLPEGQRVVILLDAIDEADVALLKTGLGVAFPTEIPPELLIVISMRVTPEEQPRDIEEWIKETQADRINLAQLGEREIKVWLEATANANLQSLATDSRAVRRLYTQTTGYPLYLHFLIGELASQQSLLQVRERLQAAPVGFNEYVKTAVERLRGWATDTNRMLHWQIFLTIIYAKQALSASEISAILEHDCSTLLDLVPIELWRWLSVQKSAKGTHVYALAHPMLQQAFRSTTQNLNTTANVNAALLRWCRKFADHGAEYALRHYLPHLAEFVEPLTEPHRPHAGEFMHLLRSDDLLVSQQGHLPHEPLLPVRTMELGLDVALRAGTPVDVTWVRLRLDDLRDGLGHRSPITAFVNEGIDAGWELASQRNNALTWQLLLLARLAQESTDQFSTFLELFRAAVPNSRGTGGIIEAGLLARLNLDASLYQDLGQILTNDALLCLIALLVERHHAPEAYILLSRLTGRAWWEAAVLLLQASKHEPEPYHHALIDLVQSNAGEATIRGDLPFDVAVSLVDILDEAREVGGAQRVVHDLVSIYLQHESRSEAFDSMRRYWVLMLVGGLKHSWQEARLQNGPLQPLIETLHKWRVDIREWEEYPIRLGILAFRLKGLKDRILDPSAELGDQKLDRRYRPSYDSVSVAVRVWEFLRKGGDITEFIADVEALDDLDLLADAVATAAFRSGEWEHLVRALGWLEKPFQIRELFRRLHLGRRREASENPEPLYPEVIQPYLLPGQESIILEESIGRFMAFGPTDDLHEYLKHHVAEHHQRGLTPAQMRVCTVLISLNGQEPRRSERLAALLTSTEEQASRFYLGLIESRRWDDNPAFRELLPTAVETLTRGGFHWPSVDRAWRIGLLAAKLDLSQVSNLVNHRAGLTTQGDGLSNSRIIELMKSLRGDPEGINRLLTWLIQESNRADVQELQAVILAFLELVPFATETKLGAYLLTEIDAVIRSVGNRFDTRVLRSYADRMLLPVKGWRHAEFGNKWPEEAQWEARVRLLLRQAKSLPAATLQAEIENIWRFVGSQLPRPRVASVRSDLILAYTLAGAERLPIQALAKEALADYVGTSSHLLVTPQTMVAASTEHSNTPQLEGLVDLLPGLIVAGLENELIEASTLLPIGQVATYWRNVVRLGIQHGNRNLIRSGMAGLQWESDSELTYALLEGLSKLEPAHVGGMIKVFAQRDRAIAQSWGETGPTT